MTQRVGKVKIYTEEGKLIREGHFRNSDSHKKFFGMFAPEEIIRSGVGFVILVFTAGGLWTGINNHFQNIDRDFGLFVNTFSDYKKDQVDFHKLIFRKLEDKDNRINCLAENLKGCCASAERC